MSSNIYQLSEIASHLVIINPPDIDNYVRAAIAVPAVPVVPADEAAMVHPTHQSLKKKPMLDRSTLAKMMMSMKISMATMNTNYLRTETSKKIKKSTISLISLVSTP
jgi:hypothetical protein